MRVPRPLQVATRALGYPDVEITWRADLDAPGPPAMSWTSRLDGVAGVQDAGFDPAGSATFTELSPGQSLMTLTLSYTLPPPVQQWKVALVTNPLVQGIVRNRMNAGMRRFANAMRREAKAREAARTSEGSNTESTEGP